MAIIPTLSIHPINESGYHGLILKCKIEAMGPLSRQEATPFFRATLTPAIHGGSDAFYAYCVKAHSWGFAHTDSDIIRKMIVEQELADWILTETNGVLIRLDTFQDYDTLDMRIQVKLLFEHKDELMKFRMTWV